MISARRISFGLFEVVACVWFIPYVVIGLTVGACAEKCRQGYEQVGDKCRLIGSDTGAATGTVENPSAPGQGGANGGSVMTSNASADDAMVGTRAQSTQAAGSNATANSGNKASAATTPGNVAGGAAAAKPDAGTAGASNNASMADMANTSSTGPCSGRAGEFVCDGEMLFNCDAAGEASSAESCMSPQLCQVGIAGGTCATCMPGTFQCDGATLNECGPDGQYSLSDTCASEALCKETAGACTEMVCVPNQTTCSADGTLRTCNADGSAFGTEKPCGAGLCDQLAGRCNKCMPNTKVCDGDGVATCSANGQSVSTSACKPKGDCYIASCSAGACQSATKPGNGSSRCNGDGYCDTHGTCVGCLTDEQCAPDETCNATTKKCEQKTCGNKMLDPGENCDTKHPYFVNAPAGTCDSNSCRITDKIYAPCTTQGECWSGAPWACAATLQCTTPCSGDDACITTTGKGKCLTLTYQTMSITGCLISCATSFDCPNGLQCFALPGDSVKFCGGKNLPPPM